MPLKFLYHLRTGSILLSALLAPTVYASSPSADLGADIYLNGRLPSGKPVQSLSQGDIPLSGTQVSCVSCHKRSGMGTSESRFQVPPITFDALFNRTELGLTDKTMHKLETNENNFLMGSRRPVYTEAGLRRAITTGIDPNGRQLEPLMPRYKLNDDELGHLIAYMRTLSNEISPGVTNDTIHFATIIAGDVDKDSEQTMLDILNQYVEAKNGNTRNETGRANRGPWFKESLNTSYRKWILDVWRLSGPADTWAKQLATLYQKQPVFAVVSGLGNDEWAPVHDFCNKNKIPCLLPNVSFAGGTDTDFYTTYFFDGAELEANSIAKYLTDQAIKQLSKSPVIQVHYTHGDGPIAAQALSSNLGKKGIHVTSIPIEKNAKLDSKYWNDLSTRYTDAIFVLWINGNDLEQVNAIAKQAKLVFLSGSLNQRDMNKLPKIDDKNLYLTYPFEIPSKQRLGKGLYWARQNKISYNDKVILGNTYLAITMANVIMRSIHTNLYRDYFMEGVEHMTDRMTTKSVYPTISLAPGQRFISKGCYIVRLDTKSKDGFTPVSDWITP